MIKRWDGTERRSDICGRRKCDEHDRVFNKLENQVPWKVFIFVMMAAMLIVGSGFGWFGNDLAKVKEFTILQTKESRNLIEKTSKAITENQKEVAAALVISNKESREQIERIANQLRNISEIQEITAREIVVLKSKEVRR